MFNTAICIQVERFIEEKFFFLKTWCVSYVYKILQFGFPAYKMD